ncbi:PQQ-binding-like beta-propeller repeat protein [Streptomyces sp. NPDC000410]|uniref:outer membrane protein assembly factor BamB family protein n=1 Tax=Streptomyces sp. NPDC000410 TaxID=3154254 RepID=UPI00331B8C4B
MSTQVNDDRTSDDRTADRAPLSWGRRLLGVLVLGGVALILVGGVAAIFMSGSGYVPGFSMKTAWEAPHDRAAAEHGNGDWLVGDTVVRSRFDAVTAFDVRSGKKRWEYVPGRADICSVSTAADDSVALIAYGEPDKGCATVAALDLTNGRELWHTSRLPGSADATDVVATGGGLAVLRDSGGSSEVTESQKQPGVQAVRAFDLRTGAPRWKAAVPKGCVPVRVAAAAKQVHAVVACDRDELKLAAFDPADGKERWTVPLDARRGMAAGTGVSFLSAEPAVVQVGQTQLTDGGAQYLLAFGQDGRPQGRIDLVGGYGRISSEHPAKVSVADGRLFAVATYEGNQGDWERVVVFDLATGGELWRADIAGSWSEIIALHAEGGRVTAVSASSKYNDDVYVFDAATGDEEDDRTLRDDVGDYEGDLQDLLTYEDLVIAVRWGEGVRPFSAYEPW